MNNLTIAKPFPSEKYELVKVIKNDPFGIVSIKKHIKKNLHFIVKMIPESNFKGRESILNEIKIGKKLRHENFAKTIKNYCTNGNHFLIIEFVEEGILLCNFLSKNEMFKIRADNFKKVVSQLFNSIIYSLNQNICPVDVHTGNILIDQNYNVKVIDYGEYKENTNIKDYHYLYLEALIRHHVSDLLAITDIKYENEFFEVWKKKLWSGSTFTKESLTRHYIELVNDPFLQIT